MPRKKGKKTIGEESERTGEEQAKRKSQDCFLNSKNYMYSYLEILLSAHA